MAENGSPNVLPSGSTTVVKTEDVKPADVPDKATLLAVLQFLKKRNFKDTEEILRKEAKFFEEKLENSNASDSDVSNVLSVYKSEGDPYNYESAYTSLKKFVESSLDVYRHELSMIFYPVFVRMYLELVYNNHEQQAIKFMEKFRWEQEEYYQEDVNRLATITKLIHMKGNELMDNFMSSHFTVRMSRDTYTFLKRHLQEKKETILLNIIQEHLYLDVYEGVPRNKQEVDATAGAMMGEATRQANKTKVYYGLLKEPDFHIAVEEEEDSAEVESGDKPKKKKIKKDSLLSKKSKNDPNAPPNNRVPLPELKDADKLIKVNAIRESAKRIKLGPEQLPSICVYTFLNSQNHVTCSEISEDSTLLSAGLADATIRVWSVIPSKLKTMKSYNDLSGIDREAGDVLVRMMDDRLAKESRVLLGHSGPIYSTSFNFDKNFMISCSADATIRLWSLQTWSNLVCYKGHMNPVWDVKFCRHGYYFASCGFDRTARLWATEYQHPLRVFTGHVSDVDCVQFHPNSNYLASGSDDRSVRLWDLSTGSCVRHMTGHKGSVHSLAFSNDGRFLASAGADKRILIWDIAHGRLLTDLKGHTDTIYSLSFSRDDNILASGGVDGMVKLWDASKLFEEIDVEDLNISHVPTIRSNTDALMLGSYPTKSTTVLHLHFTRKNLLLSSGMFVEN
uniref:Transcription initiation factor TFIID subunit 5 n=1 Tax=Strigamia maritima TaxID=126957 RepID=T1J5I9_STRMM